MKKLRQYKALFITLDMVQEMPVNVPANIGRFPAGCLYVPADKIMRENISDTQLLQLLAQIEIKGSDISNIVNLSWSREDLDSDENLKVNGAKILRILNNGIVIEGMKGIYSRFLRTPSQSRAGGAWLSNNPSRLREIISFGLEKNHTTDFEVVPSKWDASLSLCCTTSTAVSLGREIKVQVIPDLYRTVFTTVTTVETDDKAPNPLGEARTKGMVYKVLSDKKSKKLENPDIEYSITTKERETEICIGDGNAIGTPTLFELASVSLQMSKNEREHFNFLQFRGLPGCKGTITEFDIVGYCNAYGITEMRNIYGQKFDPRECDIIMFESCFKWSDRFTSMEDYYDRTIRATFAVNRRHSQFYVKAKNVIKPRYAIRKAIKEKQYSVVSSILSAVVDYANGNEVAPLEQVEKAYAKREKGSRKIKSVRADIGKFVSYTENIPYFKDHAVLRVANINKEKEDYHKLTYQYLQSLLNLDVDGLLPLTRPIYEAVKDCTTDVTVAKALWGMVHNDDTDRYSRSLVSKATEVVELKQELFNARFVQKRIIATMKNLIQDQKRGAVMCKGGYHFIAPEPAIFFYQKGIKRVKGKDGKPTSRWYVPTLKPNTKLGFIANGKSYLANYTGVTLAFRSPLIHASEVAQLDFNNENVEELNKWYGHLTGVIFFNSYDTTAMRMGGADYDGDKIYKLDPNAEENQVIIKYYQHGLPLIVSPLENLSAKKYQVSKKVMLEVDERTLQNFTGIYTNMGTYYQNLKYHVTHHFTKLMTMLQNADPNFWTAFGEFMPQDSYVGKPLETFNIYQLQNMIEDEFMKVNSRCEYCITLIRIAQAGEIDFTKHGTRFALPLSVECFNSLHWLRDYTMPTKNVMSKRVEYGVVELSWINEMGKEKKLYKMDTPMQRLCDDVDVYYKQALANIKENSLVDTMSLFLGSNYIIPSAVNAIYESVVDVAVRFGQELSKLALETRYMDRELKTRKYQMVYNKYTDECAKFSDRKALAVAGLYYEMQTQSDSNFAFICCYDGLIELLLEQPSVSPRIARVRVPKWVDTVFVDEQGRKGYALDGSYTTLAIEIPFISTDCQLEVKNQKVETIDINTGSIIETTVPLKDGVYTYTNGAFVIFNKTEIDLPTELVPGSYAIKEYFGKTYLAFGYMLDDKARKELADAHYENRTAQGRTVRDENGEVISKEHVVEVVAGKRDKFIIVGMARVKDDNGNPMPTNAVEVAQLIKEYNGQCMVVERTKDDGTTAPMLSIGGRIVGMICTKDSLKVKKDYTINYRQMYGHVFRLSVNGATKKVDGTPLVSLEVLAKVESIVPFKNPVNKIHSRCDLSAWYWNVDWKTFADFGYALKGVSFIGAPVIGQVFANVALDVNGVEMNIAVARVAGETPLQIASIVCGGQEYDVNSFGKDFEAVVYRAVSFFFAKKSM